MIILQGMAIVIGVTLAAFAIGASGAVLLIIASNAITKRRDGHEG